MSKSPPNRFAGGTIACSALFVFTTGVFAASQKGQAFEMLSSSIETPLNVDHEERVVPTALQPHSCKDVEWPFNAACKSSAAPFRIITPSTRAPSPEALRAAELQVAQQQSTIEAEHKRLAELKNKAPAYPVATLTTRAASISKNVSKPDAKKNVTVTTYMLGYGREVTVTRNRHNDSW